MGLRRRNLVLKGLILVPATWIVVTYLFATSSGPAVDKLSDKSAEVPKHKAERSLQQQQQSLHQNAIAENVLVVDSSQSKAGKDHDDYRGDQEQQGVLLPPREPEGLGEMGKAVKLSNLTAEQQKLVKLGWKNNAFNQYVSDMISIHRTLPDPRDKE